MAGNKRVTGGLACYLVFRMTFLAHVPTRRRKETKESDMTRTAQSPAGGRKRATAQWRRVCPLGVVLVAVAALTVGCGGGAPHGAASSSRSGANSHNGTSTPSSDVQSGVQFVSCIRAHGVPNFPDSAVSVNGGQLELNIPRYLKSEPQFQSALRACQKYLPGGGSGAKSQHPSIQQELNYAHCMRSHGITNFPDPLPGGGFNITGNTNSQQFQAADNACRAALGSSGSDGS